MASPITTQRDQHGVLAPALVLFGIMTAHALLETARDAMFLTRLGADRLAWAYLAIAAAALGTVTVVRRWLGVHDPRRVLVALTAVAAGGTAVFAATVALAPSVVFALYVWTGVVAALLVPALWTAIDRSLRVTDAKRVFAGIAAGGSLGALAGSALAIALTRLVAPLHLVTAAAAILAVVCAGATRLPAGGGVGARAPVRARARARELADRPMRYVRLLVLVGLIATVTLTLGDLMFKRVLAAHLAPGQLATSIGAINTAINVLGLAIQLAVTPRLLARLGVGGALTVLPLIVLITGLGFVITGTAIAIVALKIGDAGLRHSLHRVASEILFLPLPTPVRDATKPTVDVVGQRGGQAVAALLAVGASGLGAGTWGLGLVTVIAGAGWLVAVAVTRGAYIQRFRDRVAAGDIQRDVRVPELDADSVALLTDALASPDQVEAVAALDLLGRRGGRVPALVLYHPSQAVVRRALALLDGRVRPGVERALGHLVGHADPQIRAAALAAASRTGLHHDRLFAALSDPEPDVRAAATIGLAITGAVASTGPGVCAFVDGTTAEQIAIVRAIGGSPEPRFQPVLDQLIARSDAEVVREVLRVWERSPGLARTAPLIALLARAEVRGDVRRVLAAAGPDHLPRLIAALGDPATPIAVRRHLPRTISRYGSSAAAAALVARLATEPDGTTEFKILRALGRMRADRPTLAIDPAPVRAYLARTVTDAERHAAIAVRLGEVLDGRPTTASGGLLVELLDEKQRHAVERVFRALGILHPTADLRAVHAALADTDDDRRAAAREIVEDLVTGELRTRLFAVVDRAPVDPARYPAYEDVVAALLDDPSDSLRCVAAYHVGERRLAALRPALSRLRPITAAPLVVHAFDQALEILDAG